ncbi:MAG: hypothetical protein IJI14_03295 [Anaerolineaceae bacterium]|nr:hypothetical protein [Anaerolineaceae bacterium]
MSKITQISILFSLMFLFTTLSAAADFVIDMDDHGSLTEALENIPMDAGIVTLKLSKQNLKDSDTKLSLPDDRNIKEFVIMPPDGSENISCPEMERICANGIPLTIGEGVALENASIYGGRCASGEEAQIETSNLTIAGSVGFVFGGGFAENGGTSNVTETFVTLKNSGVVYFEIFGGGHAYSEGSQVKSESTSLKISGTADYVLGGGFAEDGGTSECLHTDITVTEESNIPVALFSGGSASGSGSLSSVENAKAAVAGRANWAFSGDFAFAGGETRLNGSSRLEILSAGISEIAYMGSFSSDEGSAAYVNTAELMVCGTAAQIVQNSQSTDHGEARTMVKALFPCSN